MSFSLSSEVPVASRSFNVSGHVVNTLPVPLSLLKMFSSDRSRTDSMQDPSCLLLFLECTIGKLHVPVIYVSTLEHFHQDHTSLANLREWLVRRN